MRKFEYMEEAALLWQLLLNYLVLRKAASNIPLLFRQTYSTDLLSRYFDFVFIIAYESIVAQV